MAPTPPFTPGDDINTLGCDLKLHFYNTLKDAPDAWMPDAKGNCVPISQLAGAQDGCQLHEKLGFHDCHCQCPSFNQLFQVIDTQTGKPIPNLDYTIKNESGTTIQGQTDENGLTKKCHAKNQEEVEIKVFRPKREDVKNMMPDQQDNLLKTTKTKTTPKLDRTPIKIQIRYKSIVVQNAEDLIGHPVFGSGTCTDLAKHFGAPHTGEWIPGSAPDASTPIGTLVATFHDNNGTKFANEHGLSHVGAWDGYRDTDRKEITLIDQYSGRNAIGRSNLRFGGKPNKNSTYNDDASNYFILLVPEK